MREIFTYGSVGGAPGNRCFYLDEDKQEKQHGGSRFSILFLALLRLSSDGETPSLKDSYVVTAEDFIVEREKIAKLDLIQSLFTVIHPRGIRGVFKPLEIEEILQLTEKLAA